MHADPRRPRSLARPEAERACRAGRCADAPAPARGSAAKTRNTSAWAAFVTQRLTRRAGPRRRRPARGSPGGGVQARLGPLSASAERSPAASAGSQAWCCSGVPAAAARGDQSWHGHQHGGAQAALAEGFDSSAYEIASRPRRRAPRGSRLPGSLLRQPAEQRARHLSGGVRRRLRRDLFLHDAAEELAGPARQSVESPSRPLGQPGPSGWRVAACGRRAYWSELRAALRGRRRALAQASYEELAEGGGLGRRALVKVAAPAAPIALRRRRSPGALSAITRPRSRAVRAPAARNDLVDQVEAEGLAGMRRPVRISSVVLAGPMIRVKGWAPPAGSGRVDFGVASDAVAGDAPWQARASSGRCRWPGC
jgi:hypothetical protein